MQNTKFDTEILRLMTFFENTTHVDVKDCLINKDNSCVYFIVSKGNVGNAIGKGGNNIKKMERLIKKYVKVFEFSNNLEDFVKNLIPQANKIEIKNYDKERLIEVKIDDNKKAMVIGRERKNINLFKELLKRSHNVDNIIIR